MIIGFIKPKFVVLRASNITPVPGIAIHGGYTSVRSSNPTRYKCNARIWLCRDLIHVHMVDCSTSVYGPSHLHTVHMYYIYGS